MATGARNRQERKKREDNKTTSLLLQHKLSEHKELKAETMKFSSHILFLPGLHFNQTHWQSSGGPGMTSIVVGGDEDGGKGRRSRNGAMERKIEAQL